MPKCKAPHAEEAAGQRPECQTTGQQSWQNPTQERNEEPGTGQRQMNPPRAAAVTKPESKSTEARYKANGDGHERGHPPSCWPNAPKKQPEKPRADHKCTQYATTGNDRARNAY